MLDRVQLVKGIRMIDLDQPTVTDEKEPLSDMIDKTPVVRSDQDSGIAGEDLILQLFFTLNIDMVGGFVQDQEVRLIQFHDQEHQAGLFTARKYRDRLLKFRWKTSLDQCALQVRIGATAILS